MNGCQELLRAQLTKDRKGLALSSSVELANRLMGLYREPRFRRLHEARKAVEQAMKDLEKAGYEYAGAKSYFATATKKLTETRTQVASLLSSDNLVDSDTLSKVIDQNSKKGEEPIITK